MSVCELLPSGGGSACGQNNNPGTNGYVTTYMYDPRGNLAQVNQSGQPRSYSYDGLSRLTTESNPESGTTSYTYDSVSSTYCYGGETSAGDLVSKVDANSNRTCYYYDGLHRLTDVGNSNQSATNPCLRFRYDSSTGVTGSYPAGMNPTPQNYWGRMVEAATDNCGSQVLTNEWFSYNARGDQTDAWESTPNSGGWYHLANQYHFANGAVHTRIGYLGTGMGTPFSNLLTYSIDGKGRVNGLADTTLNEAIWAAATTTFNAADQPTNLTFYNGDSESFAWNTQGNCTSPNCNGLLKSWTSTVGTTTGSNQQMGTLTWNSNGTLQQLAITDQLNSSNSQTCTYHYDDLGRLGGSSATPGVNCLNGTQSVWQQMFTYDLFGNITKSGSSSFAANYNTSYNQVSNLGFQYDSDGNVKNDGSSTYTYSVYGRPASVNNGTVYNAVYDAFSRLVEVQPSSGSSKQIVYAPDGWKFAYMNGQTVSSYQVPMAGGVQAVYTAATPAQWAYYRHADWLGSERMASKLNRTVQYDGAYAPFGESYAETGTTDRNFTGQTPDIATGLYDFTFRQYSPTEGRWLVPDPAGQAAVDITNPQTWNRYAYVSNNPLNATDPQGLYKQVSFSDFLPTFCPGIYGCGYNPDGSFDVTAPAQDPNGNFPDSGAGNLGTPDCTPPDCGPADEPGFLGWVSQFFTGAYSGVWSQNQMNSWVSQQFWQHAGENNTSLLGYLPQNQNPKAQTDIFESGYEHSNPIPGPTGPHALPPLFPVGNPLPERGILGSSTQPSGVLECINQNPTEILICIQTHGVIPF